MSRVGKLPIPLPAGVTAELSDHQLKVRGPQGELSRRLPEAMSVTVEEGKSGSGGPRRAGSTGPCTGSPGAWWRTWCKG